jgi:diacylglycerol kinase (CTP)
MSVSIKVHKRSDLHLLRKLWHMGVGLIGVAFYLISGISADKLAIALLALAAIAIVIDILRINNQQVQRASLLIMAPFMRKSELRSITGLPFYAVGVALSLILFSEKIAMLSILFLIFADPISSYVGIRFGKDKFLPNKSIQGSLAGFFVCAIITLIYILIIGNAGPYLILFALLAGLVGSISEMMSFLIDDNLTIPVISGLGLTLLNHIFAIF